MFPYESELIEEIRSCIVRFGGKVGADILKEHAIETRDILETSTSAESQKKMSNNTSEGGGVLDNSDTMEQLNRMISKFEKLSREHPSSSSPRGVGFSRQHSRGHGQGAHCSASDSDRLRLSTALREVFVNRFTHVFSGFEHFVVAPSLSATEAGESAGAGGKDEPLSLTGITANTISSATLLHIKTSSFFCS